MFFPPPSFALRLVEQRRRELLRSARKPQRDRAFDQPAQALHISMPSWPGTLSSEALGPCRRHSPLTARLPAGSGKR